MSTELGKAYVQIVPSAKGIKSSIEEVLGGPLQDTSKKLGVSFSNRIASGFKSIGGAMTSFITKPALAAVTALGGATLFSGWKRMTEIDNAKVKLQAIGNSMKDVESISQNALAAVKGTAYGMNEAMTTSASAVAAGIKPGKELESYLKAISDAAAVAGVGMADMGAIFNKVATSGKAHNDVLQQMAEAGIPIYQYLADQLGVSADQVFELAKAGEIGLSDFQQAVTNHIGGAAKEIGSKTITGALSNLKAAISRIGANFLGSADDENSFAGKMLPILNTLMDKLGPIEEKAKEFGAAFADGFQKFIDVLGQVPLPVLEGIGVALVSIGPALSIAGSAMAFLGSATAAALAPFAGIIAAVTAVGAALAVAYVKCEPFRKSVNNLAKQIGPLLLPMIKSAADFLKLLANEFISTSVSVGEALAPALTALTPVFKLLLKLVGTQLKVSFAVMGAAVQTVANLIKLAAALIQGSVQGLVKIFNTFSPAIKKFASTVRSTLSFNGLASKVKSVFNNVKDALTKPFQPAYEKIKSVVDKIKGLFPLSIGRIFSGLRLPHFNVSGGSAPWGIGGKGSMPKFSVNWYAKGGIVDGATLIGAGEAGKEAIVPLDPLWEKLDKMQGNKFYINMTVNGAEDPEDFASRFARKLEIEMRA